eukprot:704119_1
MDDDDSSESDIDSEPNMTATPRGATSWETIGRNISDNLKGIQYAKGEMKTGEERKLRDLWSAYGNMEFSDDIALNMIYNQPHGKRVCIVIDRRSEERPIYMFEPPIFNTIGETYEWYIESSSQYIMPDHLRTPINAS